MFQYVWEATKKHPFNAVTIIVTFAATLFALIAAGAAVWSAYEAHLTRISADDSGREQLKRIDDLISATQKGADAQTVIADYTVRSENKLFGVVPDKAKVKKAIESTRRYDELPVEKQQQLAALNRPVLVAEEILQTESPLKGNAPKYIITFGNHGDLPAILIASNVSVVLSSASFPNPEKLPLRANQQGIIPPAGSEKTRTVVTGSPLTTEQISQLESGALTLYVLGRNRYTDGIGIPHDTAFCFRYFPSYDGHSATPFLSCWGGGTPK